MIKWLTGTLTKVFLFIASLFSAKQWGKSKAQKEVAEQIAEERNEDAEISSKPFVSRPFGRMRRKK